MGWIRRKAARAFVCALCLCFASAWFDEPSVTTITMVEGQPLELKSPNGGVAVFFTNKGKNESILIPLQVSENTCTDRIDDKCTIAASLKILVGHIKWVKHPDPNKIGQRVRFRTVGSTDDGFNPEIRVPIVPSTKKLLPVLGSNFPADEFTCPNYSWLPGGSRHTPSKEILISRWDNESMAQNPDTEQSENRATGGAVGARLVGKNDGSGVLVDPIDFYTSNNSFFAVLFGGDILGWTIEKDEGDYCQISIKSDNGSLATQFQAKLNSATADQPWNYNSDETLLFAPYLKNIFEKIEGFELL